MIAKINTNINYKKILSKKKLPTESMGYKYRVTVIIKKKLLNSYINKNRIIIF